MTENGDKSFSVIDTGCLFRLISKVQTSRKELLLKWQSSTPQFSGEYGVECSIELVLDYLPSNPATLFMHIYSSDQLKPGTSSWPYQSDTKKINSSVVEELPSYSFLPTAGVPISFSKTSFLLHIYTT